MKIEPVKFREVKPSITAEYCISLSTFLAPLHKDPFIYEGKDAIRDELILFLKGTLI